MERHTDLAVELDVAAARIGNIVRLRQGDTHTTYRLSFDNRPAILKIYRRRTTEVELYRRLAHVGVPTPLVLTSTRSALLIEDLSVRTGWRLASSDDLNESLVMEQVAVWYRTLHIAAPGNFPENMPRDGDGLDATSLWRLGDALGLQHLPVWRLATDTIDELVSAMHKLPETLIYNDFHYSNLAVGPAAALMFDYDQMIIGPAASDCRNVIGSLGPVSAQSFLRAYGPIDNRATALDSPVAALAALRRAAARPQLPSWAEKLRAEIADGDFERTLRVALEWLR
ncbi:MAG TPA: phosphotransferase [Mycobacteriales bacterium]|nr:phosphotransferase [Mycobacteriales bacterium]